jgi:DNA mismatch repair ATPase MutS
MDELIENIKSDFDCFYKLSEWISTLDMLVSLSTYALITEPSCKPQFGNLLKLENSHHPILKSIKENLIKNKTNGISNVSNDAPVANSFKIKTASSFSIITGTNMSGKSTFLKQCGLLQIMSQTGSYVPATASTFSIKQNIFSLCGDYSENGNSKSSFEKEMSEIDCILKNLNSNSLILIDELCRSTNYYEGLALAIAICEYMMSKLNDFQSNDNQNITILFATHFKELAYFDYLYPKTKTYQMKSIEDLKSNKDVSTFKLDDGVCNIKNYGIILILSNDFIK